AGAGVALRLRRGRRLFETRGGARQGAGGVLALAGERHGPRVPFLARDPESALGGLRRVGALPVGKIGLGEHADRDAVVGPSRRGALELVDRLLRPLLAEVDAAELARNVAVVGGELGGLVELRLGVGEAVAFL